MIIPVEERIVGARNLGLHVRIWRPQQAPRAVVVICHGVNSHSGYYQWAAEQLVPAGFAVYALDLHGRGRSDGERFYLQAMGDYVRDVDVTVELAKAREPGLQVFLLGHSAGGVVSSTYCLDYQHKLAGFICESFAFQVAAPDFALAAVRGLAHLVPHAHVLRLKFEDFSRDPAAVKAMHDDPLIENEVQPTQTVAELARADERLKTSFPQITLPLLILHGAADKVTNPRGSRFFRETAGSADKTLKLYEGHAHDLLNDLDREVVIADVITWLRARMR